jgi:hypothetical protein
MACMQHNIDGIVNCIISFNYRLYDHAFQLVPDTFLFMSAYALSSNVNSSLFAQNVDLLLPLYKLPFQPLLLSYCITYVFTQYSLIISRRYTPGPVSSRLHTLALRHNSTCIHQIVIRRPRKLLPARHDPEYKTNQHNGAGSGRRVVHVLACDGRDAG